MANLKGAPELEARLKRVRLMFKPLGRKWADTAVDLGIPKLPIRPSTMRADHPPGRLHASIRRKTATQRKAVVGAHYTAYFIDAGVKPHSLKKRGGAGQDRTVFAKKHPGYKARPFRAYIAHESLRRNPMVETLIDEWNKGA
jgi:hypothetical protein